MAMRLVFCRLAPGWSVVADGGLRPESGFAGQVEAACGHLLAGQCLIDRPPVITLLSPLLRDMVDRGLRSSDPMEATACHSIITALSLGVFKYLQTSLYCGQNKATNRQRFSLRQELR